MKKKILTVALCVMTALGLVACGKEEVVEPPVDEVVTGEVVTGEPVEEVQVEKYTKAVDVLTDVHTEFDEETLSYLGGGFGEEVAQGAPGAFPVDDIESVRAMLTFPVEYIELVDGAGSMMHMMNGNLYTSAAFHVVDNANMLLIEEAILDTVRNNQWMCGFPEKLVIGQVENFIVYAYGNTDLVDKLDAGIRTNELGEVKFIEDLMVEAVAEDELGEVFVGENVIVDSEDVEGETADAEAVGEVAENVETENTDVETEAESIEVTPAE